MDGKQGCMAMKEHGTNAAKCTASLHGTEEGMHSGRAWGRGRYAQRACMAPRKVCTAGVHGAEEGMHSEPAWGRGRYAQRACMAQRKVCTASLHGREEGTSHSNFKTCAQSLSLTKRLDMKLVFSVVKWA